MDPQEPIVSTPQSETPVPSNQVSNSPIHQLTILSMAIFVLLSLGAVVFLYYQNQQLKSMLVSYQTPTVSPTSIATPDLTADWKTYTDPKKIFSVKYPDSDFKFNLDKNSELYVSTTQSTNQTNTNAVWLDISNVLGMKGTSLKEYLKSPQYLNAQQTPTKIAGMDGYKVLYATSIGADPSIAYKYEGVILKNDTIYLISLTSWNKNSLDSYSKTFDQILSTFKFLEVPAASPTATSKSINYQ